MSGFKISRAKIAQGRVKPLTIVKHFNELKDRGLSQLPGRKMFQVGEFSPEGTNETLHHGIVVRIALAAHADLDAVLLEKHQISIRRVLAASVGVVGQHLAV